ncbi:hypothetical protein KUTeg_002077 [Tegillarca granosa]|uniref:C-type lectin domain-containing protein n=1 Tax=Tegillarca granosa TaxID=220873 RepID=A0ABQ9FXM7_TEGGR|nr:hypothetical protein KUTeg_002077 [Tegillarca granosa]
MTSEQIKENILMQFFISCGQVSNVFGLLTAPACPTKTTYQSHFVRHSQKCYEFINNYHNDWIHAQTDCRSKGGNLVTIETRSEQNFLLNEIQRRGYLGKGLWIGLNDRNSEGSFTWVSVHSDYLNYYKIRGNKCYEFILSHKTDWHHAQLDCLSKGGFLVTIENSEEEKYLANYLQTVFYGGKGVWIGLNDKQVEGKYVWNSGKSTSYVNWEPGQPNDKDYF